MVVLQFRNFALVDLLTNGRVVFMISDTKGSAGADGLYTAPSNRRRNGTSWRAIGMSRSDKAARRRQRMHERQRCCESPGPVHIDACCVEVQGFPRPGVRRQVHALGGEVRGGVDGISEERGTHGAERLPE